MKKLHILPLAEKISSDVIYKPEPVERKFKISIPSYVYLIIFLITFASAFVCLPLCMILFGALFTMAGLDSSETNRHNGKRAESNIWDRLPFLLVGLSMCSMAENITSSYIKIKGIRNSQDISGVDTVIKLFALAAATILIGRLIFLVVNALAISSRKRHCTYPVYVIGDTLSFFEADPSQNIKPNFSKPVYNYYYEGEIYRFADHESLTSFFNEQPELQVYIDPDEPERYYSPHLFKQNGEKLKGHIKTIIFILFFTSPIWGAFIFDYLNNNLI